MVSSKHNSTNYSSSESSESDDDYTTLKDMKIAVSARVAANKDSKEEMTIQISKEGGR